jgi:hypothetical protein
VSIQAVSPEFGEHFSVTASFGSVLLAQAGAAAGAASAAGAAASAAAAGAASSAQETELETVTAPKISGSISAAVVQNLRNFIENLPSDHARSQTRLASAPRPKNKIRARLESPGFRAIFQDFFALHHWCAYILHINDAHGQNMSK